MTLHTLADADAAATTDIAIIGAGVAGLYSALRLAQKFPDRKITIVERLNRTGGRLQTDLVAVDGDGTVKEEEGGMRFNYSMDELMSLNKHLGLCDQIEPFPMSSEGNTNRWNVRGQSFTGAEAAAGSNRIWGELFDLNEYECGYSPSELIQDAFARIRRANNDSVTGNRAPEGPDGWCDVREKWTWAGETLNNWQMWGLLRSMGYSEPAIELMSSMNGFVGLFKAPINAGDAFQVLGDFPKDPQLYTFRDGFSTLPDAIVKELTTEHAGQVEIVLSANVDRIDDHNGGFQLTLTEAPDQQNSNPFIPAGAVKTLDANQLIIAVATTGMERLFNTSPALNASGNAHRLWENIHASRGMELMKINLYFEHPWWQDADALISPPIQYGPNFTSLPINSVYPFYSISDDGSIPDTAAALTIYCDFNNTNFWSGLQNVGDLFTSPLQKRETDKRPQTMFAASQAVVDEIIRQLQLLFRVPTIPDPILSSYRLWNGEDDFEHAYHQWRLGVVDSDVRSYLVNPLDNIYFCNEAISDMQGWVNGSLRSADRVLETFGIDPLSDDKTCRCEPPAPDPAAVAPAAIPGLWS